MWTAKKAAKLRSLDAKILNGRASRKEVLQAFDLQRERKAADQRAKDANEAERVSAA